MTGGNKKRMKLSCGFIFIKCTYYLEVESWLLQIIFINTSCLKNSLNQKTAATTDKGRHGGWLCKTTCNVITNLQN